MDVHEDREIRAARNQALFRAVNEKLGKLNEVFATLAGTLSIACECADSNCITLLEVSPAAYREARRSPRTFVVLP